MVIGKELRKGRRRNFGECYEKADKCLQQRGKTRLIKELGVRDKKRLMKELPVRDKQNVYELRNYWREIRKG